MNLQNVVDAIALVMCLGAAAVLGIAEVSWRRKRRKLEDARRRFEAVEAAALAEVEAKQRRLQADLFSVVHLAMRRGEQLEHPEA